MDKNYSDLDENYSDLEQGVIDFEYNSILSYRLRYLIMKYCINPKISSNQCMDAKRKRLCHRFFIKNI